MRCFPFCMISELEVIFSLNECFFLANVCERHVENPLLSGLVCSHHAPSFMTWRNPEQAGIPNSANSHRPQPHACRDRPNYPHTHTPKKQKTNKNTATSFPAWPKASTNTWQRNMCLKHLTGSPSTTEKKSTCCYLQSDYHKLSLTFVFQRCQEFLANKMNI